MQVVFRAVAESVVRLLGSVERFSRSVCADFGGPSQKPAPIRLMVVQARPSHPLNLYRGHR